MLRPYPCVEYALTNTPRFLYTLVVAVDACFRLKRRAVSNEVKDPILGSGWGYFVEDRSYHELLVQYKDQEEVRL